jgi:hypothetical protein
MREERLSRRLVTRCPGDGRSAARSSTAPCTPRSIPTSSEVGCPTPRARSGTRVLLDRGEGASLDLRRKSFYVEPTSNTTSIRAEISSEVMSGAVHVLDTRSMMAWAIGLARGECVPPEPPHLVGPILDPVGPRLLGDRLRPLRPRRTTSWAKHPLERRLRNVDALRESRDERACGGRGRSLST